MGKFKDITGQRFGRLVAIERRWDGNTSYWLCQCDCGNTTEVALGHLTRGATKSCGCYNREIAGQKRTDLTGERFGRLVVERFVTGRRRSGSKVAYWQCVCDCGNRVTVLSENLTTGNTTSCGCFQSNLARERLPQIVGIQDGTHVSRHMSANANKNSTTGVKGVYKSRGKYTVSLTFQGKRIQEHGFNTLEEAAKERQRLWDEKVRPYLEDIGAV